jgi:hypothetical protein
MRLKRENMNRIVSLIEQMGSATCRQLSAIIGPDRHGTVRGWVADLHCDQRIYIAGWVRQEGGCKKRVPCYRVGNEPDTPNNPMTEEPAKIAKNDPEYLSRAEVERKHERWLKEWRPHVDPAAAWMMNPVA